MVKPVDVNLGLQYRPDQSQRTDEKHSTNERSSQQFIGTRTLSSNKPLSGPTSIAPIVSFDDFIFGPPKRLDVAVGLGHVQIKRKLSYSGSDEKGEWKNNRNRWMS